MRNIFVISTLSLLHLLNIGFCNATVEPSGPTSANELYLQENYAEAIAEYESQISDGVNSGHIYYNLANAYFRNNQLGKAIANYRLALRHLPGDPEVKANLNYARSKTADRIPDGDSDILANLSLKAYSVLTENQLSLIFLLCFTALCSSFALAPLYEQARTIVLPSAILSLSFACLVFLTKESRVGERNFTVPFYSSESHPAVVTAANLEVYAGNSESFQVVFILKDGAEIEAGEQRDGWIKLFLPAGRTGWAKSKDLQIL